MNMKHKRIVSTGLITILFAWTNIIAFAAVSKSTKEILMQFNFETNNWYLSPFRLVAWYAAKGLHWLVSGLEEVVFNINDTLGGFFTSKPIQALQSKIIPIALALIVLLILFIGIMNMIKPQQVTTIISNMIVGVVIAIAIPTLLSAGYDFANQAIAYINSDESGSLQKMSDRILVDNITDVTRYEAEEFKSTTLKYKNYYLLSGSDPSKITGIDPNELVNPDDMKKTEVWSNKITDVNGKETIEELHSGFAGISTFSSYYYRWKFDWFNIFSTLLVTGTALILSSIKIARLLYELAIHQVMTQVVALLDVMTAQRLKKCIQMLIATFVTLIAVFFMLQVFIIGMTYITNVTNPFLRLILMVALAWSVIDGPNLFEQILGVDAGINSAMRTVYGLKAAGGIMGGAVAAMGGRGALEAIKAQGLIGSAKSVIGKSGGIVGTVGGTTTGWIAGMRENHQRMESVRAKYSNTGTENDKATADSGGIDQSTSKSKTPDAVSAIQSAETFAAAGIDAGIKTGSTFSSLGTSEPTPPPHIQKNVSSSVATKASSTEPTASEPTEKSDAPGAATATTVKKKEESPGTIGAYIRSGISGSMHKSTPVTSTRRAYALTKGSMQKHGNKKVAREERILQTMSKSEGISRRDAVRQVKEQIKKEKEEKRKDKEPSVSGGQTWVQQEQAKEQSQQLHKESEEKS